MRDAIWQVDKDQPVGAVRTMDEQLSNSLTRRRFSVTLLTAFGVVAVSLAAIGLYGVLAFIVAQRRREIGVRMALGAQPRDVIADVMGQGLRLAGLGVVVGLGLALAGTRLLSSLLFGTSPTDALTFAAVATLLVAIAAAASLVPGAAREPRRSADRAQGRVSPEEQKCVRSGLELRPRSPQSFEDVCARGAAALGFRRDALQVVVHLQHGAEHQAAERAEAVGLRRPSEHRVADLVGLALGQRAERGDDVHVVPLRRRHPLGVAEIEDDRQRSRRRRYVVAAPPDR